MRIGTPPAAAGMVLGALALQAAGLREKARLLARADAGLRSLRAAVARQRILNDLGISLLTTTDSVEVYRLAATAAAALAADCPGARTAIVRVTAENQTVLYTADASLPSGAISDTMLARLTAGEVVSGTAPDIFGDRPVMALPLLNGGRFFGALAVGAEPGLPVGVLESLRTLRTQTALALGGVAVTEDLTRRAMHDSLTGLGNRALLWDRMTGSLARARRSGRPVGVLVIDLNGFKPVNDTYGHDAGDVVLKTVAERLQTCVRTEDMVARLGGDEFVILAEDLTDLAGALVIADRVVHALNQTIDVGGNHLLTPASVGIALAQPTDGPDEVVRNADAAMYVAKRRGGGCYHVHG